MATDDVLPAPNPIASVAIALIAKGAVSMLFTTFGGVLVLLLAMESVKQSVESMRLRSKCHQQRLDVRCMVEALGFETSNLSKASKPRKEAGASTEEEVAFRVWQTRRVLLHNSGLNVLASLLWAHAASESECLALVSGGLAMVMLMSGVLNWALLTVGRAECSWPNVRGLIIGIICTIDISLIAIALVMASSATTGMGEPESCSLPRSALVHELLSFGARDSSAGTIAMLRVIATHLPPINFLVASGLAMTAVGLRGSDRAVCGGNLSLQVIESIVIVVHAHIEVGDTRIVVSILVCQWFAFGAALFAVETLYAPLTRELYRMQQRSSLWEGDHQCAVCLEHVAVQAFVPCGHRCCCACSDRIMNCSRMCPHCRSPASDTLRVF